MAKVLIVEDDAVIADGMARHLSSAGFDPVVVGKGEQGLARLRFERPDVLVLDLMLPERDGWSVIQEARAEGIATPIVVVSARGTEHDRIHALEIGADDYMVKPFSMNELVARVRAASRRARRRDPFRPSLLDHAPAVTAREHQVEHDDVGPLEPQAREPLVALACDHGIEPSRGKVPCHSVGNDGIVLDDQDFGHTRFE